MEMFFQHSATNPPGTDSGNEPAFPIGAEGGDLQHHLLGFSLDHQTVKQREGTFFADLTQNVIPGEMLQEHGQILRTD